MIEKLRRALYGRRSERKERLLDQLELALDELTAERDSRSELAARTTEVSGFVRRKPSRKPPIPEHLRCANAWWSPGRPGRPARGCGARRVGCRRTPMTGDGRDPGDLLEVIPRRWKVIQTVRLRQKFTVPADSSCAEDYPAACTFHATPARGMTGMGGLCLTFWRRWPYLWIEKYRASHHRLWSSDRQRSTALTRERASI